MAQRKAQHWLGIAAIGLILGGCRQAPPPRFATWFQPAPAYELPTSSSNAYDDYMRAGIKVEVDHADVLGRIQFSENQKKETIAALRAPLQELDRAVGKSSECHYRPQGFLKPVPGRAGLALLSKALLWQVEDALNTDNEESLVRLSRVILQFGSDLTQGPSMDADLGYTLLDDFRKLVAPRLDEMGAGTLSRLAANLQLSLTRMAKMDATLEFERQNMLAGVQYIQDAYQDKDFEHLKQVLGKDAVEGVNYLEQLSSRDGAERERYFADFAKEVDVEIDTIRSALSQPPATREELPIPGGSRPWKRFAKQMFRTLRPLLDKREHTIARTKLFCLTCQILALTKSQGTAPQDLSQFNEDLLTDPITGKHFGYGASGRTFRIYSLGMDQLDNGGKTDEEFETPDLTIERLQ